LVLLVGSGLFLRTLVNLNNVETGFNKENVLVLHPDESSAGYKAGDPRLTLLHQQIEQRVGALPGVSATSYSSFTFNEGGWSGTLYVQGYENNKDINVSHNIIGAGYFPTMQIPLLTGRGFSQQDTATSLRVAVISETMARTMFPMGSPIGRHYGTGGPQHANDIEVVGIAKDVKYESLAQSAVAADYFPYTQWPGYLPDLEVRYSGDLSSISAAVQKTIHSVDRNLPINNVTTLDEQVALAILDEKLVAQLSTFFGLLAVFLSSIGIYGLMSYVVSRRTNEIGIRMALGANRSQIQWQITREITLLVGLGVAIGIPVTLAGGRLVTSMLYGLHGTDPWNLVTAICLLVLVAILVGYLPARRASRVDPMVALRNE
jgi:predicted permease